VQGQEPAGNPTDAQFAAAPYGFGKFFFKINYQAPPTSTLACIEDPNAGIGNNCTKCDDQNSSKGCSNFTPPAASVACKLNGPGGGTTLTYQFACAEGVSVDGFLTLVPRIGDPSTPQPNPSGSSGSFTNCSPARIAAGECTMKLGGIPTKQVKVKGQLVTVVDSTACAAAFPTASVPNAFASGQTQTLGTREMLFYQEVATEGICDPDTELPTVPGLPAAAYSRYCQSDLGPMPENPDVEGFDNILRVCPVAHNVIHTAAQDVEQVKLGGSGGAFGAEPGSTLNLNCTTGGNTDSGKFKIKIPDQAPLLATNIDVEPLATEAPKLEGISPLSPPTVIVDGDGVRKLELTYPTCGPTPSTSLSDIIIAKYNLTRADNNTDVTLQVTGQTQSVGLGPVLFEAQLPVKVNGL
jgi:hypothetical protein